jgi:hypothetical protein
VASALVGLSLIGLVATGCDTAAGAGAGAASGAGTGDGAGRGALIGTGVATAAGAIHDVSPHRRGRMRCGVDVRVGASTGGSRAP